MNEELEQLLADLEAALDHLDDPAEVERRVREEAARNPEYEADILAHFAFAGRFAPPAGPAPPRFRPGDRLSRFTVTRFVARGGMGEVYEAWEEPLQRAVAVKVLRPDAAAEATRRFEQEARVQAEVHHRNVVPVYHTGEHGGVRFTVMQFVRGASLQAVLGELTRTGFGASAGGALRVAVSGLVSPAPSAGQPVTPPATIRPPAGYFVSLAAVLAEAADALHHTHQQGYCHRDVKPSNLMIDAADTCRVIDFGLADLTPPTAGGEAELAAGGHRPGGSGGTPEYMAPEQYDGRADPRSDVWGLGVTLYQALTGRLPFTAPRGPALEAEVRTAAPILPRTVVSTVPPDLQAVCLKALAKNPDDRYPSAAALADDLRRWLGWRPTTVRPGWWTFRPLRLWAWRNKGLAAALVLAAVLAGVVAGWQVESAERRTAEAAGQAERLRREAAFLKLREELPALRPNGRGRIGWPEQWNAKLDAMRDLQPGANLDDLRAAALVGLDAEPRVNYSVPQAAGQRRGYSSVAFSPTGKRVAAGGTREGEQSPSEFTPGVVWGDDPDHPTLATEAGSGPVAFADDDTPLQLLTATADGRVVRVWDLAADRLVIELPVGGQTEASALAPLGRFVAVSNAPQDKPRTVLWAIDPTHPESGASTVREWDVSASALAFSPDGEHLAVGTADGGVRVCRTADGKDELVLPSVRLRVQSLAFGRTFTRRDRPPVGGIPGLQLAVGTTGGLLQLHDLEANASTHTVREFSYLINSLAFSPDGTRLGVAGHGNPAVVDVATGRVEFEFERSGRGAGLRGYFTGVAFAPDGRRVALSSYHPYGGGPGGVDVFELDDARGVRTYRGLSGRVEKAWLSPSREWVAAVSQQWRVGVWHRPTCRLCHVWEVPAGVWIDNTALAFAADEKSFYFAGGEHVTRYAVKSGDRLDGWAVPDGLNDNLFANPDGRMCSLRREADAPGKAKRFVLRRLLDGGKMEEAYRRLAPPPPVHSARVYAGGTVLAVYSGGDRRRVTLYDAATATPLPDQPAFPESDQGEEFVTDDGQLLCTRVSDGTVGSERVGVYRVADGRLAGEWPSVGRIPLAMDAAGELFACIAADPRDLTGLSLVRAGEPEALITFDVGERPTTYRPNMLTSDGRYLYWGRADGAVLVADVDRCLAALGKSRKK